MKISYNWLKDIIALDKTPHQITDLLTGCGLEVEGIEPFESVKGGLHGIVIGEVKNCEKHPNADKLKITTVDIGAENLLNIVCGAPNVAAGQKVLVAPVGTIVNPIEGEPFEIKKAKIRGEVSEGMICAEDELSLGKSHEGILVLSDNYKIGAKATDYFEVYEDVMLEIGLTANRGDAASHLGVARDLRALTGNQITNFESRITNYELQNSFNIQLTDGAGCKRYSGISISGIEVKPSPDWIQNRLRTIGINPINNIVDATNYVLHELGQPLHAFDADKLAGKKIVVKKAEAGYTFTTLDKISRKLNGTECMICDAEKPVAIGGVFGGLDSGISETTKNIFIESAYFDAASIRKTAKYHGLSTDASFRYERGTDPDMTIHALKRVTNLILEIAGGQVSSEISDIYPEPVSHTDLRFSISKFNRLIGQIIPTTEIINILQNLDISVLAQDDDYLNLSIPPYRSDVKREADVAEEILRIYGLNKIEIPQQLKSTLAKSQDENAFLLRNKIADYLSSNGFMEMLSNSLTKSAYYSEDELKDAVKMLNPLSSDLDIMRKEMLFNGLEMIQYNANRKTNNIKAFEYGLTYRNLEENKFEETPHIAIYLTGNKEAEAWNTPSTSVTYFTLKTVVNNVLSRCGLNKLTYHFDATHARLNNVCEVKYKNKTVAIFGEVEHSVCKNFDIEQPVFYGDILWNEVKIFASEIKFYPQPVSPYPAVRRDLALLLDKAVRYADLEKTALKTEPSLIRNVNAFDVYEGDKIEKGKKSYALSFILQDENKTLTDTEIEAVMNKLIKQFEKDFGATLRS